MNYIYQNKNNKCASVSLCNLYIYYYGKISEKLEKSIIKNCSELYNSNSFFSELDKACDILDLTSRVIKFENKDKFKERLEKFCSLHKNILMVLISSNNVTHSFLVVDYRNNKFLTVGLFPQKENVCAINKDKFYKLLNKMKKQEPFIVVKLSQKI